MLESPAQPGPFFNPYQQTKYEAEQVVLAAMGTIPATIYRFSTMVYEWAAERISQFNYFHHLLRLAAVNPLRAIPALGGAKFDLIASDWAARILNFFIEEHWQPEQIVHICAGADRSLTVGELFDVTFDMLCRNGNRPQILTKEEFEREAGGILSTPSSKQMWESLSQLLPHMNINQTFECQHLNKSIARRSDLAPPDARCIFQKRPLLLHCHPMGTHEHGLGQLAAATRASSCRTSETVISRLNVVMCKRGERFNFPDGWTSSARQFEHLIEVTVVQTAVPGNAD